MEPQSTTLAEAASKDRYISLHEVAAKIGFSYETVRRYVVMGTVPAVKLGRWRVKESDIDKLFQKMQSEQADRVKAQVGDI